MKWNDETKWWDLKYLKNRWKLSFSPLTVNGKKHVKWPYIRAETHDPTFVETSKIYPISNKAHKF